jgi:hypothetical protein
MSGRQHGLRAREQRYAPVFQRLEGWPQRSPLVWPPSRLRYQHRQPCWWLEVGLVQPVDGAANTPVLHPLWWEGGKPHESHITVTAYPVVRGGPRAEGPSSRSERKERYVPLALRLAVHRLHEALHPTLDGVHQPKQQGRSGGMLLGPIMLLGGWWKAADGGDGATRHAWCSDHRSRRGALRAPAAGWLEGVAPSLVVAWVGVSSETCSKKRQADPPTHAMAAWGGRGREREGGEQGDPCFVWALAGPAPRPRHHPRQHATHPLRLTEFS